MYIRSVQVHNYKSFVNSEELSLEPGISILTGQNNAGKTALLEAISLKIVGQPAKTLRTCPSPHGQPNLTSSVDVCFAISASEIRRLLSGKRFNLPRPQRPLPGFDGSRITDAQIFIDDLLTRPHVEFLFTLQAQGAAKSWDTSGPSLRTWQQASNGPGYRFTLAPDGRVMSHGNLPQPDLYREDMGRHFLLPYCENGIYMFRAERFNAGTCRFGNNSTLKSDASNLAEVLLFLQANPSHFREFMDFVRAVLPQVQAVTIPPNASDPNGLEVRIWQHDVASGRQDLSIPLSQSGSGVGQVLAIAHVVISPERGRVILIDEPNSFLHPGAVRRLLNLLRAHAEHQFIISTHSPQVLAALPDSRIFLIKQERQESTVTLLDANRSDQLLDFLSEVGSSLSDVFGADRVLWVEGATEEVCFPEILKHAGVDTAGTVIRAVKSTGDITGKHASLVLDLYRSLSEASTLMPAATAFVFDSELRGKREKEDLTRRKGVYLLPRRMFENYLLEPEAIALLVNEVDCHREVPITIEEVGKYVNGAQAEGKYFAPACVPHDGDWQKSINGALLMSNVLGELTEGRCHFEKKKHCLKLTKWLSENKPYELREVSDLLREIFLPDGV